MNINQKGQKSLFEDIKNAHISDFGGFVEETRRAVGFVAEELGITKVDCVLSVPQELFCLRRKRTRRTDKVFL